MIAWPALEELILLRPMQPLRNYDIQYSSKKFELPITKRNLLLIREILPLGQLLQDC